MEEAGSSRRATSKLGDFAFSVCAAVLGLALLFAAVRHLLAPPPGTGLSTLAAAPATGAGQIGLDVGAPSVAAPALVAHPRTVGAPRWVVAPREVVTPKMVVAPAIVLAPKNVPPRATGAAPATLVAPAAIAVSGAIARPHASIVATPAGVHHYIASGVPRGLRTRLAAQLSHPAHSVQMLQAHDAPRPKANLDKSGLAFGASIRSSGVRNDRSRKLENAGSAARHRLAATSPFATAPIAHARFSIVARASSADTGASTTAAPAITRPLKTRSDSRHASGSVVARATFGASNRLPGPTSHAVNRARVMRQRAIIEPPLGYEAHPALVLVPSAAALDLDNILIPSIRSRRHH